VLQLYFTDLEVREDLLAGPMGPYLPSLAVKPSGLGYSRGQARRLIATADALGRWLKQQGVSLTEATADHFRAYVAGQPRTAAGKLRNAASGLTHVVEFLKPWGILSKPLPCSPADEHLQRFDNYLQRVRGNPQRDLTTRLLRWQSDANGTRAQGQTALSTLP